MKLRTKTTWASSKPGFACEIPQAVKSACQPMAYSDPDGAVERAKIVGDRAAEMLGRLIETLHKRKLLTRSEVLKIIDPHEHEWEIVPKEESK